MNLESELSIARSAVEKACQLCAAAQKGLVPQEKHDKADKSPVTVADYGAQAVIFDAIFKQFPNDKAVGEEDSGDLNKPENKALLQKIVEYVVSVTPDLDESKILSIIDRGNYEGGTAERFWTLDPIDGTKGFLRGEQYAVALALIENGEVILGVLGCPNLPVNPENPDGEKGCIQYAIKGKGAFQYALSSPSNVTNISTDDVADPALASFCESVESGHTSHDRSSVITKQLGTTATPVRIDSQCKYAAVARGQASIYLRLPTRPGYQEKIWDHAAGHIILQEAGGKISDTNGAPLDFSQGRTLCNNLGVVATSAKVHDATIKAVIASA
ncbi:3'(2'),5'-bisphosphate nucleotidase [Puniceicoccaceae bacterium K14]|nr:3'(2'),5'-bisphosphate nucleotidase [Puniceicoccaceae bacterium K14]